MPAYSKRVASSSKTCRARASDIRVHFKNTRETAQALSGLSLRKAQKFLRDVIAHRQIVPFRRFNGGVGRKAQVKQHVSATQGRWPSKSAKVLLDLLRNAESNAKLKKLNVSLLKISHIQVNRAQQGRRRTYRAHGRINAYMSNPCHIELHLTEKTLAVKKPAQETKNKTPTKTAPQKKTQKKTEKGTEQKTSTNA